MAALWVGNIAPGTTDDELKALLAKYGFPDCDRVEHFPGDGTRPAVALGFPALTVDQLRELAKRVNGVYWKERTLNVQVM